MRICQRPAPQIFRGLESPLLRAVILLVVCLLVYLPAIRGGFIWDDDVLITGNRLVRSAAGLPGIWRGEVNPDYFPLTSTLFWLEDRLWGLNPMGFHIANVLLHACAAILLWRVLLRLRLPWPWLAALLFAVHPVAVGTVAWIAEGKSTLSMVLALAALLQYLKWRDPGAKGSLRYALALSLFLLALLSKTIVVTLPLVFLLCDWWRTPNLSRRDSLPTLPFMALSLLFGAITIRFQSARAIAGATIPMGGSYARFCAAGKALWFYAIKLLAPAHLAIIYPPWSSSRIPLLDAVPALLLLAAFGLAWKWRATVWGRGFLFGFGAFCLALLPVAGLMKMYFFVFAPVADHLQYLAMPAFLALLVGAADALAEKTGASAAVPWALGAAALLLGTLSALQSAVYKNQASLWSFALRQNPDSFEAHDAYALTLAKEGSLGEAIAHLQEAVRLNPAFLQSRLNLALMFDRARRFDESIAAYREALSLEPRIAQAHMGLGNVLLEKGLPAQAAGEYEETIRLDPSNGNAHENLGTVLESAGQLDAAIQEYEAAARLTPDDPEWRMSLGVALFRQHRIAEAAPEFEAAVRLTPDDAEARNNFGAALMVSGSFADAAAQFREALRINPRYTQARQNLEKALAGSAPAGAR